MIKRLRFLLVILSILATITFLVRQTEAQTPNLLKVKSAPVALNIDASYIPCEDPSDPLCVAFPAGIEHPNASKKDHEMLLSSGGLLPNTEMYITGCINTASGTKCTTGSSKLDILLNSSPGGDTMVKDPGYEFEALTNPAMTDANGELKVIVRSFTSQVTSHIFNAYYFEDQAFGPTIFEYGPSANPEQALHLQTFREVVPTKVPKPKPRVVIRRFQDQDPKGRTFDTQSLEPVMGIKVALLDNFKNLFQYKTIVNPQVVKANGEFNFWVANGIYYLSFSNIPPTHTWPVKMEEVNPNYSLAYYCDPDVKNSESNPVPLYYDQFSIIEYNKLVHCDVPLNPGTNTPYRSEVTTLDYGLNKSNGDGQLNYSGRVSHPFTKIIFRGLASKKTIQEIEADKFGFWKLSLPAGSYPLTSDGLPDQMEVWYQKRDLTNRQLQFSAVKGVIFEPLLRYLEGYAYDSNHQIMPYAKVGLKQENSEQVMFLTTADKDGLFRIGSQYIPSFPYDLVFTNPQGSTTLIKTSTFAGENKTYLQQKQLNLISEERENVPLTISSIVSFRNLKANTDYSNAKLPETKTETKKDGSSVFILFLTILILAVAGVLIASKFRKKNQSSLGL